MQKLEGLVLEVLKKIGIKRDFSIQRMFVHWQDIVGDEVAKHSRPAFCRQGMLMLAVDNSSWMHHLSMMRLQLITKINQYVGEKIVADIRFQAGDFKSGQNNESDENRTEYDQDKPVLLPQLTGTERENIRDMTGEVQDSALRNRLYRLLEKEMSLRKVRQRGEWRSCRRCGCLCPPEDGYCSACDRELSRQRRLEMRKLLLEVPWLKYEDFCQYFPCEEPEFRKIKHELTEDILLEVYSGSSGSLREATAVMLLTGLKPENVTEAIIGKTLLKFRRKKYVLASGV